MAYKLRFTFQPGWSESLLLGILALIQVADGKELLLNEIRVASSYPGKQYPGSFNSKGGLIPPGKWEVSTTPRDCPGVPGINAKRVGLPSYFYDIYPNILKMPNGVLRGDFGIHYDGNTPGSLGCICPVSKLGWQRVIEFMAMVKDFGQDRIPLEIVYN
jgi:hypothetical protein